MSNAAGGQILIAESTASKLGRSFDLERLPEMKVKGRSEAVPVFSVGWEDKPATKAVSKSKTSKSKTKKRRPTRGARQPRKIST
jgi:hypothetical protein